MIVKVYIPESRKPCLFALRAYVGCVNTTVFDTGQPGTMAITSVSSTPVVINEDRVIGYSIRMTWEYNADKWGLGHEPNIYEHRSFEPLDLLLRTLIYPTKEETP